MAVSRFAGMLRRSNAVPFQSIVQKARVHTMQ